MPKGSSSDKAGAPLVQGSERIQQMYILFSGIVQKIYNQKPPCLKACL